MLSICIPTFNVYLNELVEPLLMQIERDQLNAEIVVIDDCSAEKYTVENRKIGEKILFVELPENIGRAKIRNRFLDFAKGDYLLFLDCDSAIIEQDFLKSYFSIIKTDAPKVIVGSSIYQTNAPKRDYYLRWKVSANRESKTLQERAKASFNSFKTNNFVVSKEELVKVPFNETIIGYGHEDTLFGFELQKSGIEIYQCDNPVLNKHLDNNDVFLEKTAIGIRNLIHVTEIVHQDPNFIQNIKLLKTYYALKKRKLIGVVGFCLIIISPILKFFLHKGYFTLKMFDAYKLNLFIKASNKKIQ